MRHSKETIQKIIELRKNGFTLGEIVTKTNLSKTTILHHIQSIPQSSYLKEKIRIAKLNGQRKGAAGRKGKSVKSYSFLRPAKWNSDLVNLISHFLFDGRISNYSCTYFNRSETLIQKVKQGMKDFIVVSDYKIYKSPENVIRIAYHHVEIATFIRSKADDLLGYISSAPYEHKISFLKAFFDDEGLMTFNKNKRIVRGYQHSIRILNIIKGLLKDLEIESTIDNRQVEISINKKENIIKFQKLINFTPGLRINGNRSNSIWKKDLEKRHILQMAIDSYLS